MKKPDYLSEVRVKTTPEIKVIYLELKGNPQNLDEQGVQPLVKTLEKYNIIPAGPNIGYFHTDQSIVPVDEVRWDYCVPVPEEIEVEEPVKFRVLPSRRVASIIVKGSYSRIGDGYHALLNWGEQENVKLKRPLVEVYHKEYPEEDYETELQLEIL